MLSPLTSTQTQSQASWKPFKSPEFHGVGYTSSFPTIPALPQTSHPDSGPDAFLKYTLIFSTPPFVISFICLGSLALLLP